MKKLVNNKKDFAIAIILATFVLYAVIFHFFSNDIQTWLLGKCNFRLTEGNQPDSLGELAITFWIMTIVVGVVLFIVKKSWKQALIALLIGATAGSLTFAAYFWDCDLIASVVGTVEPASISANGWGNDNYDLVMDQEQEKQLTKYCEELEPMSKDEQKELQKEIKESKGYFTSNSLLIWLHYPKKYGHNFSHMVCVYQDKIYIRKGYDKNMNEIVTFCKDNGLLEFIKEVNKK